MANYFWFIFSFYGALNTRIDMMDAIATLSTNIGCRTVKMITITTGYFWLLDKWCYWCFLSTFDDCYNYSYYYTHND